VEFFLGTDNPAWLRISPVPLFVSHSRLRRIKGDGGGRAIVDWALDSGAFTDITTHGRFLTSPADYVKAVRKYRDNFGRMQFASIQDFMSEPHVLKITGLTVEEHRKRTVQSYLTLRDLAPEIPWCPVVQGWQPDDYRRTIELYDKNGVNLERLPIVGVGSVCRRQGTAQAVGILRAVLHEIPQARLHGFGFKTQGLMLAKDLLVSADSMAWSVKARREGICLPGHSHPSAPNSKEVFLRKKGHQKCSSCIEFAIRWRNSMLVKVAEAQELEASKSGKKSKQLTFAF